MLASTMSVNLVAIYMHLSISIILTTRFVLQKKIDSFAITHYTNYCDPGMHGSLTFCENNIYFCSTVKPLYSDPV